MTRLRSQARLVRRFMTPLRGLLAGMGAIGISIAVLTSIGNGPSLVNILALCFALAVLVTLLLVSLAGVDEQVEHARARIELTGSALEDRLAALEADTAGNRAHVSRLQQHSDLQNNHFERSVELWQHLDGLIGNFAQAAERSEQTAQDVAALSHMVADVRAELAAISDWRRATDPQLEQQEGMASAAEQQIGLLANTLAAAELQIGSHADALAAAQQQIGSHADALAAAQHQIGSHSDALAAAQQQIGSNADALAAAGQQIASCASALADWQKQVSPQLDQLSEELTASRHRIDSQIAMWTDWQNVTQTSLDGVTAQLPFVRRQIEDILMTRDRTERSLALVDASMQKVQDVAERLHALETLSADVGAKLSLTLSGPAKTEAQRRARKLAKETVPMIETVTAELSRLAGAKPPLDARLGLLNDALTAISINVAEMLLLVRSDADEAAEAGGNAGVKSTSAA